MGAFRTLSDAPQLITLDGIVENWQTECCFEVVQSQSDTETPEKFLASSLLISMCIGKKESKWALRKIRTSISKENL